MNTTSWKYIDNEQLGDVEKKLIRAARDAQSSAYVPYSGFRVGAAVLLEDGTIVSGSNFENASYPLCLCAERTALAHVHGRFPDMKVLLIAVTADSREKDAAVMPCGACRQVMYEWEKRQQSAISVLVPRGVDETLFFTSISDMLPLAFEGPFL